MADEERKPTEDSIKTLTNQIISNSKDAKWAKDMLTQLAGLYQMDKEIDIAANEVTDTIDLGACAIKRCKQGYIFDAKGGLQTFVSWRMGKVCAMLNTIFEYNAKADKTDDEQTTFDAFVDAVLYVFQCPIFSSLDERALFQNSTSILSTFQEFCNEHYTNAEAVDESEQDLRDNAEFERQSQALEELANAPIPPEDKDE